MTLSRRTNRVSINASTNFIFNLRIFETSILIFILPTDLLDNYFTYNESHIRKGLNSLEPVYKAL